MKLNLWHLIAVLFHLSLTQGKYYEEKYCSEDHVPTENPSFYSIVYKIIKSRRQSTEMDSYANGSESFDEYFQDSYGWFALFVVFLALSGVMIATNVFLCVFCPNLCRSCKKDLKRVDYQKADKVRPFVIFLLCSLCSMAVAGYGFYVLFTLQGNYQESTCSAGRFLDSLSNNEGRSIEQWNGFQNETAEKFKNLDFVIRDLNNNKSISLNSTAHSWIITQTQYFNDLLNNRFGLRMRIMIIISQCQCLSKLYKPESSKLQQFPISADLLQTRLFRACDILIYIYNQTIFQFQNRTRLWNISQEHNLTCGNRLIELQYIYTDMLEMQNEDFANLLWESEGELKLIANQTKNFNTSADSTIESTQGPATTAFIILLVAFILMCAGFIFSIISLACVIQFQMMDAQYIQFSDTREKIQDVIKHFMVHLITGLGLSFGGPVLSDFCRIQEKQSYEAQAQKYPNFTPPELSKHLHQSQQTKVEQNHSRCPIYDRGSPIYFHGGVLPDVLCSGVPRY